LECGTGNLGQIAQFGLNNDESDTCMVIRGSPEHPDTHISSQCRQHLVTGALPLVYTEAFPNKDIVEAN